IVVGVAVDQSGHLWVADDGTDNILEFDADGNFIQQWQDPFSDTLAIAVDSTNGFVYLIRGLQTTERFNLTGGDQTEIDPTGAGVALAADQQTGILYADHGNNVAVWDTAGTQVDAFTLTGSNSEGIAFGSATGHAFVSDATANNVTIYGVPTPPGPPLVQSESFANVTDTSVTLNATIVPF